MTQHTPGPWRVAKQGELGTQQLPILRSDGKIIAAIRNEGGLADARLIAAAPELLEALKTLVRRVERGNAHTTLGCTTEPAQAAIAKAEVTP